MADSYVVGESEHPLVREVHYIRGGGGNVYFELLHIQWMPMRHPYLDVIEVSVGESTGKLVSFGKRGRTIVTASIKKQEHRERTIIIVSMRGGSLTRNLPRTFVVNRGLESQKT